MDLFSLVIGIALGASFPMFFSTLWAAWKPSIMKFFKRDK